MNFKFFWFGPNDYQPEGTQESAPSPGAGWEEAEWELLYGEQSGRLVRRLRAANGSFRSIPVANFVARIVAEIVLDDGVEQQRQFVIEADLAGQTRTITIAPDEFGRMGWVLRHLGPRAILYPGQQQHARAAIQSVSGAIRREQVFTHTGWRQREGEWVYLHSAGAIGRNGAVANVHVPVDDLQRYELGVARGPMELVDAVRASLRLLKVVDDRISFPVLAAVYRAALGGVGFSLFLTGQTGVFKTAISALAQQRFGKEMDASGLPANFSSTANSLELRAFQAKDTVLVVDDFAPTGGGRDSELQAVAERLFRAAGNRQSRSRMAADGQLRPAKPPRALVLATGEEVPAGHSIRGRLLIVEVAPGDVNREVLSECQRAAADGLLAVAMGGFVEWIAGRYDAVQRELHERAMELRSQFRRSAAHARTPGMLAELLVGWETFLRFAAENDAITATESERLKESCHRALLHVAGAQLKYQDASDPALRFLALLNAALGSGQAHVADRRGGAPEDASAWGWQREGKNRWIPMGARIGWVSGGDLLLEPAGSYEVVQAMAGRERIPISEQTLRHRLADRGLLASIDHSRQTLQVRRVVEGISRRVLHLKSTNVLGGV